MSGEEAKPKMASKSLDTSHGMKAATSSSQPGIQSPIKQETTATDTKVKEEMCVVEVLNDDDDSSDEVSSKLTTKEARVGYLMGNITELVGCAHCDGVLVRHEYTVMENKMKRQEDAPAVKMMKCEEATLMEQEIKSGDDALVKEETKYEEDVLVEEKIKCAEGAAAKEEPE